jgi:hypothetical protein
LRNISFNYLNRLECTFNRKCILFFHSVHWNGDSLIIMRVVFLLGFGLFVFQVKELFKTTSFTKKSTDLYCIRFLGCWLISQWELHSGGRTQWLGSRRSVFGICMVEL